MDYLNLHLTEVCQFNIHVSPFIINCLLYKFDPSKLKGYTSLFRHNVFDPIWHISSINMVCYIIFNFMPLPNNVGIVKRIIFILCFIVNTVVVPLLALEWIIHQAYSTDLNANIYSEWMFTFVYLTFMPAFIMMYNFR